MYGRYPTSERCGSPSSPTLSWWCPVRVLTPRSLATAPISARSPNVRTAVAWERLIVECRGVDQTLPSPETG